MIIKNSNYLNKKTHYFIIAIGNGKKKLKAINNFKVIIINNNYLVIHNFNKDFIDSPNFIK
jgi:hypothetical protein